MKTTLVEELVKLAALDEKVRSELIQQGELFDGYHPTMEQVHNANADALKGILDDHGWPHRDKFGEEASQAAWLIVQHAIGKPNFQKQCLQLLKSEPNQNAIAPSLLAALEDRIAVFEGRPQVYGTQFDWDADGKLSPNPILDPSDVDARRNKVGLPSLDYAIKQIRQRAELEKNQAPRDLEQRKKKFLEWAQKVGWR